MTNNMQIAFIVLAVAIFTQPVFAVDDGDTGGFPLPFGYVDLSELPCMDGGECTWVYFANDNIVYCSPYDFDELMLGFNFRYDIINPINPIKAVQTIGDGCNSSVPLSIEVVSVVPSVLTADSLDPLNPADQNGGVDIKELKMTLKFSCGGEDLLKEVSLPLNISAFNRPGSILNLTQQINPGGVNGGEGDNFGLILIKSTEEDGNWTENINARYIVERKYEPELYFLSPGSELSDVPLFDQDHCAINITGDGMVEVEAEYDIFIQEFGYGEAIAHAAYAVYYSEEDEIVLSGGEGLQAQHPNGITIDVGVKYKGASAELSIPLPHHYSNSVGGKDTQMIALNWPDISDPHPTNTSGRIESNFYGGVSVKVYENGLNADVRSYVSLSMVERNVEFKWEH